MTKMSALKLFIRPQLEKLRERAKAMSVREKALTLVVCAAALYFAMDELWGMPQNAKIQAVVNAEQVAQSDLLVARTELQMVLRGDTSMLLKSQAEYQRLQAEAARLKATQARVNSDPPHLAEVVTRAIAQLHNGVSLSAITSAPTKLLIAPSAKKATGAKAVDAPLYRHSVEIELQGSYLELLACVQSLQEALPQVLWAGVTLKTLKYPMLALNITLVVLSEQEQLRLL